MKTSKHKTILYICLRQGGGKEAVVLDSFATYESAQDKADELAQMFLDKNIEGFSFSVQTSCFYDQ